jgi:hypothetical protein
MKVRCHSTSLTTENKEDRENRTNTAITDITEACWQLYNILFSSDHCITSCDVGSQKTAEVEQHNENMHFEKSSALTIIFINYNFQNIFHSGLGKANS